MLARKALAGTAGTPKVYVEDVFSTYLYTGNGSTQTITNNIDLSGEGGLVWQKTRSLGSTEHILCDTARGVNAFLRSNLNNAEVNNGSTDAVYAFNNNGFSTGTTNGFNINLNGETTVSWTFRKAEKFFDIVTYTGNFATSGAGQTINHNLGSTPGCIIVKRTDTTGNWRVYHRGTSGSPNYDYLTLNQTTASTTNANNLWDVTSTSFYASDILDLNNTSATYVAYLFAHDAGGFGDAGSDSIIKCGSFTTDGSGNATVTLDWEPQWVMWKRTNSTGNWTMVDNMRGWSVTNGQLLSANTSNAESANNPAPVIPNATGFKVESSVNATFIYIAIRRGPMKTPTTGTSVYNAIAYTGNDASNRQITGLGFPPDLALVKARSASGRPYAWNDRVRGLDKVLVSTGTDDESSFSDFGAFGALLQDGITVGASGTTNEAPTTYIFQGMRRAPGFFDVVCGTGTGANVSVNHNLGVIPELIIVKLRSHVGSWQVGYWGGGGSNAAISLDLSGTSANLQSSTWSGTATSTTFDTRGTAWYELFDQSGRTYVAYLFASLSGVSKIGTYTGNGSSVTVTTDFQPRFILVKRTDSTGNWIVGDSARGLPTGNDPALFLNTTAGETTGQDWVDVSSTGFTVNETALNANVNTGTYLYLAVA